MPRVGIFGGTFDPIHIGHLVAAEEARTQLMLSKVLFVPAGQPPHKQGRVVTPVDMRVAMVQLAVAGNPHFVVSRVDLDRPGPHYSVDMVRLIAEEEGPQAELFFIVGMDSLVELLTWRDPARLLQMCIMVAMSRPGYRFDRTRLERAIPGATQRIQFLDMPPIGISSTDIQERVRRGKSITYLVPAPVEEFIHTHHLYLDHWGGGEASEQR